MDFVCVCGCFQKNRDGWFILENPINIINMNDLGVALFSETPIYDLPLRFAHLFPTAVGVQEGGFTGRSPCRTPKCSALKLESGEWTENVEEKLPFSTSGWWPLNFLYISSLTWGNDPN